MRDKNLIIVVVAAIVFLVAAGSFFMLGTIYGSAITAADNLKILPPRVTQNARAPSPASTSSAPVVAPIVKSLPPLKQTNFSFPYPVTWKDNGGTAALTKVTLGTTVVVFDVPPDRLGDYAYGKYSGNRGGGGVLKNPDVTVYALTLYLKAGTGPVYYTGPSFDQSLRRSTNETGDLVAPEIMSSPSRIANTVSNEKVIFVVPETEKEFTILVFPSGSRGDTSKPITYFTVKVLGSGNLTVEPAPTQG